MMKKVTKAVIPAAGLGTRVLPATKAMPKGMLPIVDKQNRYLGFISKSRILNAYREQLVKISL